MPKLHFKNFSLAFLIAIFCLATLSLLLWNEMGADQTSDWLFRLRGERTPGLEITLVFISEADVQALGGWPMTRDDYGYLTHILNQAGARVIGCDFLFSGQDQRFPEHDHSLAHFFKSAQNVVLPFVFGEVEAGAGSNPI